jgi:hypothetical protein
MHNEEATERAVPQHVKELRAIEWDIADIVKRLEALGRKVHNLAEEPEQEQLEERPGSGL